MNPLVGTSIVDWIWTPGQVTNWGRETSFFKKDAPLNKWVNFKKTVTYSSPRFIDSNYVIFYIG